MAWTVVVDPRWIVVGDIAVVQRDDQVARGRYARREVFDLPSRTVSTSCSTVAGTPSVTSVMYVGGVSSISPRPCGRQGVHRPDPLVGADLAVVDHDVARDRRGRDEEGRREPLGRLSGGGSSATGAQDPPHRRPDRTPRRPPVPPHAARHLPRSSSAPARSARQGPSGPRGTPTCRPRSRAADPARASAPRRPPGVPGQHHRGSGDRRGPRAPRSLEVAEFSGDGWLAPRPILPLWWFGTGRSDPPPNGPNH